MSVYDEIIDPEMRIEMNSKNLDKSITKESCSEDENSMKNKNCEALGN